MGTERDDGIRPELQGEAVGAQWLGDNYSEEWLTPQWIIDALGPFDLDPCASVVRPWPTATVHFTEEDDGLTAPWQGFVWMNPPYGKSIEDWMLSMAAHNNGIALVFARLDSAWFLRNVWTRCSGLAFLNKRLSFVDTDGVKSKNNGGSPSVLVAYGQPARTRLRSAVLSGTVDAVFVSMWEVRL